MVRKHTEQEKKEQSEKIRLMWQDPKFREKVIKARTTKAYKGDKESYDIFIFWLNDEKLSKLLLRTDVPHCFCCGKSEYLEKHHIHARSLDGGNELKNKALLCFDCHKFAPIEPSLFWKWMNFKFKDIYNPPKLTTDSLRFFVSQILLSKKDDLEYWNALCKKNEEDCKNYFLTLAILLQEYKPEVYSIDRSIH